MVTNWLSGNGSQILREPVQQANNADAVDVRHGESFVGDDRLRVIVADDFQRTQPPSLVAGLVMLMDT